MTVSRDDPPAGAVVLGDHDGAVGVGLDDRVSDVREVGDVAPAVEVAAGGLRAALEDVARDRRRRELVVVGHAPAELVHERSDHERRVGAAAGDHDVGARGQRIRDRLRAEVHVRALQRLDVIGDRLAGLEVVERLARRDEVVEPGEDVVTFDDADADPREAVLAHHLRDGLRTRGGVHAARVGDDLDALLRALRQDALDHPHEVGRVPGVRVRAALLLHDAHRDLGEIVERQVVQRPFTHQADGPEDRVAPETLPVPHEYRFSLWHRSPYGRLASNAM